MVKPKWWYIEYFKVVWRMTKKFFYDVPHFWFKIAHYNFWWEFANSSLLPFGLNKKVKLKRHKLIFDFLNSKYWDFINEYKNKEIESWNNTKKIWTWWWQWLDKAPEMVKICIESMKKNNCWYEVVIIDKDSYKNYVELPEFILEKVEDWKLSLIHLYDILRMALLKKYWWIWADSTMFICNDVFKEFNNIELNTNYPTKFVEEHWWFEKWCWFFIWWKSNRLFSFVYDFFIKYHQDYSDVINYFLIDYTIWLAYKNFDDCKINIDNTTLRNGEIFTLQQVFNETYEKEEYDKLMGNGFFKLSHKLEFNEYDRSWNLTNYGHFMGNTIN